ncbi:MAG TPA: hypothetical protein VN345_17110 [Blastocatellia bacterium]|nr:hypothetical protein [Blastocatellia bacterium]
MIQRLLLVVGLGLAALLLGKFAIDFLAQDLLLGAPFVVLVLATLITGATNLFKRSSPADDVSGEDVALKTTPKLTWRTAAAPILLVAAIPLGFLTSSLDCTGLSLSGCSHFCTFVKDIWVPMIALGGIAYLVTRSRAVLLVMTAMSFLPLVPNCVCYNVANAWWIDHMGASPECYSWGLAVSVVSLSSVTRGVNRWASVVICYAIIGGASAFFVGHHYFHFPW